MNVIGYKGKKRDGLFLYIYSQFYSTSCDGLEISIFKQVYYMIMYFSLSFKFRKNNLGFG